MSITTPVPVPPLINGDSYISASKCGTLYPFSNLTLPRYQSVNDVVRPAPGQLIYVDGTLSVYNGTSWEDIETGGGGVWTQQGSKLVGTGSTGFANQGYSVSLSSNGNTLAVGGYSDDSQIGAVWIFTRSEGGWTQQGSKLIGTGAVGDSHQGHCVSLSGDGNTLAVGGYRDNSDVGATWIFTRSAGVWTQQGSKLVGTGAVGTPRQGYSVSLSSDGNTLAVGGRNDGSTGATWIFTRSAGVWTQQGSKLVGTGAVGNAVQGYSVSLYGDTLAVGGQGDDGNIGAVWIFTRTAGVWTQQGSKLVGSGAIGASYQGYSVSLSSNGNTLASGGYDDDNGIGATWIFTRSVGIWTQQGSKLIGTGAVGNASQGSCVSLSGDGNTLASGAYNDDDEIGAVWIFTRSAGVWTQYGSKLVGTGYSGIPNFAYDMTSIALSPDGRTLAVGGYYDDDETGATWIFTN